MTPYLSVVIVGRNDNYGVNFMSRLNTFVRHLDYQVRTISDLVELIVVEWNPLSNFAPLSEVLYKTKNLKVRVITVSNEVHNTIGSSSPVLEFHGKNVGIRRSCGQFVLTTNPDILFTDAIINEIRQRWLKTDTVYRTDRYDYKGTGIEQVADKDILPFALDNTFLGHLAIGSYTVDNAPSLMFLPRSQMDVTHTNGCGDFILASKEAFFSVNGLVESTQQRWHLDSYSLFRLLNTELKQVILKAPACIFHMDHDRKAVDIDWDPEYALEQAKTCGDQNWGLNNIELPEWEN